MGTQSTQGVLKATSRQEAGALGGPSQLCVKLTLHTPRGSFKSHCCRKNSLSSNPGRKKKKKQKQEASRTRAHRQPSKLRNCFLPLNLLPHFRNQQLTNRVNEVPGAAARVCNHVCAKPQSRRHPNEMSAARLTLIFFLMFVKNALTWELQPQKRLCNTMKLCKLTLD